MPANVLHIINGQYLSGPEHTLLNLARAMEGGRYRLQVACLFDGPLVELARRQGLAVHVVPMRARLDLRLVGVLRRLIEREEIRIVHTHSSRANLVGRTAARLAGRAVVSHCHASTKRETTSRIHNWLLTAFDRLNAAWVDRFVTISDTLGRELTADGVPARKVATVRTAVDLARYTPRDGRQMRRQLGIPDAAPVAGMIALLRPRKGPEGLLRAAARILERLGEARFLFIGRAEQPAYLESLKSLAAELSIEERVLFTGFRRDIPELLSALDVLAIPSLFGEDVPLVLIEAMAMARPVVASAVEGIPEVVRDGQTGYLVPPGDIDALAAALCRLLANRALARRLGAAGRASAEGSFSLARMAQDMTRIYDQLLADGRRH